MARFPSREGPASRFGGWLDRFARARRGGVAMIFALSIPVIAVLACGAVDLAAVNADKNTLQDTADSAALAAAKQLTLAADPAAVGQRAKDFVAGQLTKLSAETTYTVTTTVAADRSSVTVAIDGVRVSFFANMLPPGGWKMHAEATAAPMGQRALCVLATGTASNDGIFMGGTAQLSAPKCLVHTNDHIAVAGSAWLQAAAVESVGASTGHITPTALTDAPQIADPFASMDMKPPVSLCTPLDLVFDVGVNVLAPGIHCGNLTARAGATVVLLPGDHYFMKGHMTLANNATLQGTDVVMVFDDNSEFQWTDGAQIRLEGRKTGKFAGFVIATTRANVHTFQISADGARELLGTIYIPSAKLQVLGTNNRIADQSAWTVIVAKQIDINGSANVVINADYAGSSVPVPGGVGPSAQQVVLRH
jgi:Flp pilus assembly protein TadG